MLTLKTSDATIYRKINNELVVVQLDTGRYFFFNPETEKFLETFKQPKSIENYCAPKNVTEEDKQYLHQFCRFLLESQILKETNNEEFLEVETEYVKPEFLRAGEKTIDQISFLCP